MWLIVAGMMIPMGRLVSHVYYRLNKRADCPSVRPLFLSRKEMVLYSLRHILLEPESGAERPALPSLLLLERSVQPHFFSATRGTA